MNFASKFAYQSDEEEEEEFFSASDSGSDSDVETDGSGDSNGDYGFGGNVPVQLGGAPPAPAEKKVGGAGGIFSAFRAIGDAIGSTSSSVLAPSAAKKRARRVKPRRQLKVADTNVMTVSFGTLLDDAPILTGEIELCKKCNAAFNMHSKRAEPSERPEGGDDGEDVWQQWTCEFCGHEQLVNLFEDEIPKQEIVDYYVEGVQVGTGQESQELIVFCVDTSGSMCQTVRIDEKRSRKAQREKFIQEVGFVGDQWYGEPAGGSYVSRLESVQAAVAKQIKELPDTARVAVIQFNSEVKIVGDGVQEQLVLAGDRLNDFDRCLKVGEEHRVENALRDSRAKLEKCISGLEPGGQTALGPAVTVALGMAKDTSGARVLVCTDGCANIGVGNIDSVSESLYRSLGEYAQTNGVTVSCMSFEEENCRMEKLGELAELSGGQVDMVNPREIDFNAMLRETIIASKVSFSVRLHDGLEFSDEPDADGGFLKRRIGNATASQEVSFQYKISKKKQTKNLTMIPFQVQIEYMKPSTGEKRIRVITRVQKLTNKRQEAEVDVDLNVLQLNAVQHEAQLAHQGMYEEAKIEAHRRKNLFSRVSKDREDQERVTSQFLTKSMPLQAQIRSAIKQERMEGISFEDKELSAPMGMDMNGAPPEKAKKLKKAFRSERRPDTFSTQMYQNKR